MAVSIIIYFGLRAGFSLLKLHPLELGSCLNSCNRNELRFPGKGNANLAVKCFLPGSVSYSHPGILSVDRDKGLFQMKRLSCTASHQTLHLSHTSARPSGRDLRCCAKEGVSCSQMTVIRIPSLQSPPVSLGQSLVLHQWW